MSEVIMRYTLNSVLSAFSMLALAGCSMTHITQQQQNTNTRVDVSTQHEQTPEMLSSAKVDVHDEYDSSQQFMPLNHHQTLVNYVEQMALDLVDTLESGNDTNAHLNIAVTTLVNLDATLNNTNQLGNQISETLIHQLQKFGYGVVDFKTTETIDVNSRGDFVLSRDIAKLNEDQMASHVLAGTLIYRRNGVAVNARVINIDTKQVVATSRKLIPLYVLNKEDIYLSSN